MFRKLMLVLLAGTICLLAVTSVLAQKIEIYNASDYEQLTGKKLEYQEAPMLRTMVAAGELPPVEQRLPEEPLVIKPAEEIGQYGGKLRLIMPGYETYRMDFGFEFLAVFLPDFTGKYPNVLKGWKGSEDATKFTFYLRKGMKWSDGHPFTADDFMFWYEDVALNKELSPSVPSRFTIGGKPGVMRKIGDYTVECSFPETYGLFIENLCRFRASPFRPKHYLKQFHPDYTPMSEIEKVMKKEGFESWVALFNAKDGDWDPWKNPERPTLSQFIPQNLYSDPMQIFIRNPYYWKVDTEGNQLPYVDRLEYTLIKDAEAQLLKVMAGDVDLQDVIYFAGGSSSYTVLMQNREKGNYRLLPLTPPTAYGALSGVIDFNMSHKDPVLKKLFNDKRFRIALSVALNREEVNGLIHKGLGRPSHMNVPDGPPYYGEKLFQEYLQYDPELANQLLDEVGLSKRDKEGYRLRPDGKRLRLVCKIATVKPEAMEVAELYKDYWKKVGVEVLNKPLVPAMSAVTKESGEYDIISSGGGRGAYGPQNPLTVRATMPMDEGFNAAPQWGIWVATNGEKGEEPPEAIKQIVKLRSEALSSPDEKKRIALTIEILKIFSDNFWTIGGVQGPPGTTFWAVHNRVGNATREPGILMSGELLHGPSAQLFIKE